jgi:hypothetical protein
MTVATFKTQKAVLRGSRPACNKSAANPSENNHGPQKGVIYRILSGTFFGRQWQYR